MTRLLHFVKSKNLTYLTEDVKKVFFQCKVCAQLKPQFYQTHGPQKLIKAMHPMDRLSIDYKGSLPSSSRNKYLLTVVDEYFWFPFAFACPDLTSGTVIKCLDQILSLCGFPRYINSDRGTSFVSQELKSYLTKKGIASSISIHYHPTGYSV